jgi:hypothetical protein
MEVEATGRANLEVALEVLFLHRITASLALAKEPLPERFLLGGIDSCSGLGELSHGGWLA